MKQLLKLKGAHSPLNLRILSSKSVSFTLTTVQVPNLALTHTKRITEYLQVLCEGVQSREVNKSQLPRILNKIKLHISIEEQYTLSTQVSQFHRVH
jgi:hypothetical protein